MQTHPRPEQTRLGLLGLLAGCGDAMWLIVARGFLDPALYLLVGQVVCHRKATGMSRERVAVVLEVVLIMSDE